MERGKMRNGRTSRDRFPDLLRRSRPALLGPPFSARRFRPVVFGAHFYLVRPISPEDLSALHHKLYSTRRRDFARRVSLHRDQIRQQARLHRANATLPVQHLRVHRRRGAERLDGRHSVAHHQLELTRVVTMREDANIAAIDRKSTRLNSSHVSISYAVFCLKKKNT